MNWKHIKDELPPINESVIFTNEINGEFTPPEIGEWQGAETQGVALAMSYGAAYGWLPCTHWMAIPALPEGAKP